MPGWKLFADKLTDLEDELQRMRELCEGSGETEAAQAASVAGQALLDLARVVIEGGERLPLATA